MSLIQGTGGGLGGAGAPGGSLAGGAVFSTTIDNSLRLNSDSSYLYFAQGTPTDISKWTINFWLKRAHPLDDSSDYDAIFGVDGPGTTGLAFLGGNLYLFINYNTGGSQARLITNRVFRDPSAWYNFHITFDRAASTDAHKVRLYVNGVEETSFSTDERSNITSSSSTGWNVSGLTAAINRRSGAVNSRYHNGYFAQFYNIDGAVVAPTEFAETNGGVWVPKEYSGTYGNNGWLLEFKQKGTGTGAANTVGADTSGRDNHWTSSGVASHDVMSGESPTNNFAVLNPLDATIGTPGISEGNLRISGSGSGYDGTYATIAVTSGKWYAEFLYVSGDNRGFFGIAREDRLSYVNGGAYIGSIDDTYGIDFRARAYTGTSTTSSSGSQLFDQTNFNTGDIGLLCFDVDAGKLWFGRRDVSGSTTIWYDSSGNNNGDPSAGSNPTYTFTATGSTWFIGCHDYAGTELIANFGQDGSFAGNITSQGASDANGIGDFNYIESGFLALCTSNLPDITIGPGQDSQADDNFNPILYNGSDFTALHIGAGGARRPADTITIANSLQFSDSSLHRDITSSGNTQTWTWSAWVKRSSLGGSNGQYLFTDGKSSSLSSLNFDSNDKLYAQLRDTTGGTSKYKLTTRTFKSLSTWYHIVWRVDTTQSTDADRSRIYINGTQITAFDTEQHVDQNDETTINASGDDHLLGAYNTGSTTRHFDGYMAEVTLADGQSYGPETFGQVGANGDWIPKTISGITYGQNGFRLTFETAAYPGYDYQTSDRSTTNDFDTTDNVASSDILIDSPTQNFSTLDSQRYSNIGTFSRGGLTITTSTNQRAAYGTIAVPSSGKWYYEVHADNYISSAGSYFGWGTDVNLGDNENGLTKGIQFSNYNEQVLLDGTGQSGGYGVTTNDIGADGDVFSILLDVDNGLFYYAKNGTYFNSANPSNGTGGLGVSDILAAAVTAVHPMIARGGSSNETYTFNFGQDASFHGQKTAPGTDKTDANGVGKFLYDVPTGFLALMDDNIPQEGVTSPDFVWIKKRSGNASHYLFDTVRGAGKDLHSDATSSEASSADTLKSFDSQGFTVGLTTDINDKDTTYVAWTWKAGGPAPTQTYEVIVSGASGANKYRFDGNDTDAPTLNLQQGGTYTFDQSDGTNSGHPLRFSTTSNGTHGGGSEYTVGVTTTGTPGTTGAKTVITVAWGAPTLYYYCTQHSAMGGQANTTETRGSSNFKGSIPSVVSTNTTAGFSVVSFDTDGNTSGTVGHGLSVQPQLILGKTRNHGVGWYIQTPLVATNLVGAFDASAWYDPGYNHYNDTHPTTSVFSVGGYMADHADLTNPSTKIAYCFANVEGYSKIGTYVGGGSSYLPFVFTGFRPAFVLINVITTGNAWFIYDNKREGYNEANDTLSPNYNTLEDSTYKLDLVSNGFKIRSTQNAHNQSGQTFLYYAIAEAPFKFANAR